MCSRIVVLAGILLALAVGGLTQKKAVPAGPKPLILETNQGEQLTRRPRSVPMASSDFLLKIDPQNGGSSHLVVGTEEMPPGQLIPRHKHLEEDEVLLVQTSTAHVWLGEQEREVHAGAVIFIPAGTWISLKNVGNENLSLVFIFSAPGFDQYLRCISVRSGEKPNPMTDQELQSCQQKGHAIFSVK